MVGGRSSVGVVLFTRNLFMDIREFHLWTAGNRSSWKYVDRGKMMMRRRKRRRKKRRRRKRRRRWRKDGSIRNQ